MSLWVLSQLDKSYPDTTGRTPPVMPGPNPKIPALSHALLSHILPNSYALAMPSPWSTDTSDGFTQMPKTMPLLSLGPAAPVLQILKFNGYGEFAGLLYHLPHTVLYRDKRYPVVLHLFEARKFLDHRPDLADRIRECKCIEVVTSISAELTEFTRPRDWSNVALNIVSKPFFHASCVSRGCLFFMANRDGWTDVDGRGVVPQVLPAPRSVHAVPQYVPRRTCVRRVG